MSVLKQRSVRLLFAIDLLLICHENASREIAIKEDGKLFL